MKSTHPITAIGNLTWREAFSGWGLPVLALAATLLILGAPLLVASKEDASLIPSARTQLACFFAWVIPLVWAGMRIATIGASQRMRNLTLFWRSMGVGDLTRYIFLWLPFGAISTLSCSVASLVYFMSYFNGPQPLYETGYAAAQFVVLSVVVQSGLLFLTLGLSSVLSSAAAFFIGTGVYLYCLYGITLLGFLRGAVSEDTGKAAVVDIIWSFSPQLRLGDLSTRLIFNWGAMPTGDFSQILIYCVLWTAAFFAIGYAAFRRGQSSSTL